MTIKIQGSKYFPLFLKGLAFISVISFLSMSCSGVKLSELESLINFIRVLDPQNVLHVDWNGSAPNPCLLESKGIVKCNVQNVVEIRLENLNLSGIIDAESLCKLKQLRVVNLANNYIRGNIPDSILNCSRLVYLNLSSNYLSGKVPADLPNLKYLRILDVSRNHLSRSVPYQQVKNVYRKTLNSRISHRYSTRQWLKIGDTIHEEANPSSNNTLQPDDRNAHFHLGTIGWVLTLMGIVAFAVFLYFIGKKIAQLAIKGEAIKGEALAYKHESPVKLVQTKVSLEEESRQKQSEIVFLEKQEKFSLEDLYEATADLRSQSIYSSLYKVVLKNNAAYAVKRLKKLQVSVEEFGEKLRKIGHLKHPNILPLVGYHSNHEEQLLIYRYQSNGSLQNLLEDNINSKREFPWNLRLSIAYGIARGLAFIYQREDNEEIIPHGNLKLSNILLSENNEPLISEYGISKFLELNKACLFYNNGYTAPEKRLSEEGDVYSFGVILLELLTGKVVDVSDIDLPTWVRSMVREEWTGEVFDKQVAESGNEWAFPLLNVGLKCVSFSPENRPNVAEVMDKIEEVMHWHQEKSISSSCHECHHEHDCHLLHSIIPDTWDTPASNY